MVIAEVGRGGGHETGQRVDELARLVEVGFRIRLVGETALDRGRAQQVHRHRVDDLDRWDVADVPDLGLDIHRHLPLVAHASFLC
jgi:hypothetical protein